MQGLTHGQILIWLVVEPTPLKNMSQLGLLFPTEWKQNMFQTTKQLMFQKFKVA
jgi:hypothetical protein